MPESDLVQTAPATDGSKRLSVRGLWEVFTKPTAFFTELSRSPKILVPMVVIAILTLVFFVLTADMIFELQKSSPQFQQQMESAPGMTEERMKAITTPFTIGGGTISMLILPLITAALALFWGNFVMGGRATYRQLLSVALYCQVLFVVGMILLLPMVMAKGDFTASFSLAVLAADKGIENPLYVLLSKFSVFHIWEIIVLGIGCAVTLGIPRSKGLAVSLLSVGLISLIHVISSFIFS